MIRCTSGRRSISAERLLIRRYADTPADIEAAHSFYGNPEMPNSIPVKPMAREQVAALVARQAGLDDEIGIYLGPAGEPFGGLGFILRRDAHGGSYATEAAEAILRHAFDRWDLRGSPPDAARA